MKRLRIFIDGCNLAHRLRHVHQDLRSPSGKQTGVCFGVLNAITRLMSDFPTDEIVVLWDPHKDMPQSWRYKIYPEYKAARKRRQKDYTRQEKIDYEEFYTTQIPDCMTMLAAFGIPQVQVPYLEADDLISAMVMRTERDRNTECFVMSTDKDMLQLTKRFCCRIFNPHTKEIYYVDKLGQLRMTGQALPIAPSPKFFLFRRALAGDTSDSIPGVPGVADITAAKVINGTAMYRGDLMNWITENTKELQATTAGKKVLANLGSVQLSYRLMQLGNFDYAMQYFGFNELIAKKPVDFIYAASEDHDPKAWHGCTHKPKKSHHWKLFLQPGMAKFGSPFYRFFIRRGFNFIYQPDLARSVLKEFKRLDQLRTEMYTGLERGTHK